MGLFRPPVGTSVSILPLSYRFLRILVSYVFVPTVIVSCSAAELHTISRRSFLRFVVQNDGVNRAFVFAGKVVRCPHLRNVEDVVLRDNEGRGAKDVSLDALGVGYLFPFRFFRGGKWFPNFGVAFCSSIFRVEGHVICNGVVDEGASRRPVFLLVNCERTRSVHFHVMYLFHYFLFPVMMARVNGSREFNKAVRHGQSQQGAQLHFVALPFA